MAEGKRDLVTIQDFTEELQTRGIECRRVIDLTSDRMLYLFLPWMDEEALVKLTAFREFLLAEGISLQVRMW